ncbi:MAG: leucine-rich repeat domain-containing protein [Bacteroidia bacterium]
MDSTITDTNGFFLFKNFPVGDYSIWLKLEGFDNTGVDVFDINTSNPQKRNLHFKVDDGILVCIESNYSNIKDALENKEHVYILKLNSIQHDVAEKSLVISPDGSKMLSPKIGEFENLESLSVDINQLNSFPTEIGKLGKLTTLNANLNKLSALPNEMSNLKNLKTLNLGKNNFNKFPDLIPNLSSLEVLNFENNPITVLPPAISGLKNLKELKLASCFELSALPVQMGELSNLEMLNLSNCGKLKSLPKELNNLKNLKVLDITGTTVNASSFKKAVPGCDVRTGKK